MRHILVVEDDPMMASLEELSLRRFGGYNVTVSSDPDEVLALVDSGKFDAVIMDVSLGKGADGIDLTRQLKNNPKVKNIPIILATAHANGKNFQHLMEGCGANDHIAKPFRHLTELADKMKNVFIAKSAKENL